MPKINLPTNINPDEVLFEEKDFDYWERIEQVGSVGYQINYEESNIVALLMNDDCLEKIATLSMDNDALNDIVVSKDFEEKGIESRLLQLAQLVFSTINETDETAVPHTPKIFPADSEESGDNFDKEITNFFKNIPFFEDKTRANSRTPSPCSDNKERTLLLSTLRYQLTRSQ